MQELSELDPTAVKDMIRSLSSARFAKFIDSCGGDEELALKTYLWNAQLSQSLYIQIHFWEVCFRNKINAFLCWKYNKNWPKHSGALRNFKGHDRGKIEDAIRNLPSKSPSTDQIVAELTAGFWVSQISKSYQAQYAWRHNVHRIFPHNTFTDIKHAHTSAERLLDLRNRISHQEPIYSKDPEASHADLHQFIAAMCGGTAHFSKACCNFQKVFDAKLH
ncbi:MAG: hypothetical protein ABF266_01970 [Celeribacter marinus]